MKLILINDFYSKLKIGPNKGIQISPLKSFLWEKYRYVVYEFFFENFNNPLLIMHP